MQNANKNVKIYQECKMTDIRDELAPIQAEYDASNITEAEYQTQMQAVFATHNTITEQ